MHDIAEHDSEEEWEGDDCWHGWVELFVGWCTVRVNDLLEYDHELTFLE